jgi:hypothetical protein
MANSKKLDNDEMNVRIQFHQFKNSSYQNCKELSLNVTKNKKIKVLYTILQSHLKLTKLQTELLNNFIQSINK